MRTSIDVEAFNAFEASGWEEMALGYDAFLGRITSRVVEPLLDAAGVGPGVRALDVGTGPGYAAALAAQRGASVTGVDIAEAMISLARRLHPGLHLRQGSAEALPFADGSFDAVVANFLLHHLGHSERGVGELARVLAPGGRLALTVWDAPSRARFVGVLLDAAATVGPSPPSDIPAGPDFFRFSDEQELVGLLAGQGLERIEVHEISFSHPVASGDELWDGLLGGTVRTSAIVQGQPASVRSQIRAAFKRLLRPYAAGGRLELPVSVKLASARKRGGSQTAGGSSSPFGPSRASSFRSCT